eukprot:TRINITY_DN10085_c0_g1_i1.p1 TRINITY_DN10085_c0_g1~~TRINITY_DN10085_c0_g1_i1.p1  ORF type:complete len:860 (-),score=171.93 TRINITY_DN10085_c0_g1_i1:121-2700(-)
MTCNNRFLDVLGEDLQVQLPIGGFFDPPFKPKDFRESVKMLNLNRWETYVDSVETKSIERRELLIYVNPKEEYLAPPQISALMLYTVQWRSGTRDSLYYSLNEALRTQNRDQLKPFASYLYHLLQAFFSIECPPDLPPLYRAVAGSNLKSMYPDGDIITWNGFTSSTSKISILENFLKGGGGIGTLFQITTFNARPIKNYSYYENEEEYLIPPFSKFRVTGSLMLPGTNYVYIILEQIPSTDQQYLFETCAFSSTIAEQVRLANRGNVDSQTYLGYLFSQGEGGVEQDEKQAVYWYTKAAQQGYATGQCHLAFMYLNGRGVEQDDEKAFEWYYKAAVQDHSDAQCGLAFLYANGRGTRKDEKEALKWYSKSADHGNERAKQELLNYSQNSPQKQKNPSSEVSSKSSPNREARETSTRSPKTDSPFGGGGARTRDDDDQEEISMIAGEWEEDLHRKSTTENWAKTLLEAIKSGDPQELDLSKYEATARGGDDEVKYLAQILPSIKSVTQLKLHNYDCVPLLKSSFDGFKLLTQNLPHTRVTFLDVSNMNLGDKRIELLASALPRTRINKLFLRENKITDIGAETLANVLRQTQLVLLDLRHNNINDEGAKILLEAIPGSRVAYLLLYFNKEITPEMFKTVLDFLPPITFNKLQGEALEMIGSEKTHRLLSLFAETELTIEDLGDEETFYLGQILPHSKIMSARLKMNMLSTTSLVCLLSALPRSQMKTLIMYDFSFNPQLPERLSFYLSLFVPYSNIVFLCLRQNKIGDRGAIYLASTFPSQLRVLDLCCNLIANDGAICLFNNLQKSRLKALFLAENQCGFATRFYYNFRKFNLASEPIDIELKEVRDWDAILNKYSRG